MDLQEELTITYNAQPALLTTSYAFVTALKKQGLHQIIRQDIA